MPGLASPDAAAWDPEGLRRRQTKTRHEHTRRVARWHQRYNIGLAVLLVGAAFAAGSANHAVRRSDTTPIEVAVILAATLAVIAAAAVGVRIIIVAVGGSYEALHDELEVDHLLLRGELEATRTELAALRTELAKVTTMIAVQTDALQTHSTVLQEALGELRNTEAARFVEETAAMLSGQQNRPAEVIPMRR